ncbi:mechanosensitive ion channel domain-containing protein [uncultured Thiodictyon sp.]|uniref:mechanosensitive ion channel domain-containing protein n=1 Tax=uncultured Thiodictyon sp. TaxID=1846217 RepID=UPI0025E50D38|nr:mechanosensitive ion channel domain-containing protein [uncultured Thiodictyon sp.]
MKTTRRRRFSSAFLGPAVWLLLLPCLLAPPLDAHAQAAGPAGTAPPAPIPLAQIAPSATAVAQLLRGYAAYLIPSGEIEHIRATLTDVSAKLESDRAQTLALLREQPSLETLQAQEQSWSARQLALTAWLETLTARATRLQGAATRLAELHGAWTLTRQTAQATASPAALLQQVDDTLASLAAAQPLYRAQRDETLDLQTAVARAVARCEDIRTRVLEAQEGSVGEVFARTGRPLWSPVLWSQGLAVLPERAHQIGATLSTQWGLYLHDRTKRLPLHLATFFAILIMLRAARGRLRQWTAEGADIARIAVVFDRPIAAALMVALMFATSVASPAPPEVKNLLGALALVPMILVARPLLDAAIHPGLYTLGLLFALDRVRHTFGGVPPVVDQAILFAESLAAGGVALWLVQHLRSRRREAPPADLHWVWRFLAGAALAALTVGLLAALVGSLQLARLTTPTALVGAALALFFYTVVEVVSAVIAFALRVWPLQLLNMVRNHRKWLELRAHRLLIWVAVLSWWYRYLDYLGLWDPLTGAIGDLLAARLTLGTFSTSAGDLLAFVLTLWFGYLFSATLRFILAEEVYPRSRMPAGASYATSSLLQYGIAILALFIAVGFLGITLTQVTVFAGALGVGIGLGLQNVVQNFVSGLILLFEQPIHVGDAVQMGELQGRVRRIGIRASVVRTVQGAEVIIPNSQLTATQVTNWTLSDQQRRLDLPVGVSYGSEPGRVIELLEEVARTSPGVLCDPPPRCYFMGYGDSAINFELRVWTEYDQTLDVRSTLATEVYQAIYGAGLCFPFPQREIRLLSDESK